MTLEELARKAGMSVGYLNRLELGTQCNPSCGVLMAIAGALGVKPGDLLTFRVLFVDDDERILRVYERMLSHIGDKHNVDTEFTYVADAFKALEVIQTQPTDVVFCDIVMPGMDGMELTRRIKSDEATKAITVIGVSGLCEPEKLKSVGAEQCFSKPLTTEQIVSVVQSLTLPVSPA